MTNRKPIASQIRAGIALILVVIVIALITTAGLSFALLMQQANQSSRVQGDLCQSILANESGGSVLMEFAAMSSEQRRAIGGWQHNPAQCLQSILVLDASQTSAAGGTADALNVTGSMSQVTDFSLDSGMTDLGDFGDMNPTATFDAAQIGFVIFTMADVSGSQLSSGQQSVGAASNPTNPFSLSANDLQSNDVPTLRLGLEHESAKLHLQTLLRWEGEGQNASLVLQNLSGVSPVIADRILDWIDDDQNARPLGAEALQYAAWGLNYIPPNRVPHSLDELLLIPGVSPQIFFGAQTQFTPPQIPSDTAPDSLADLSRTSMNSNTDQGALALEATEKWESPNNRRNPAVGLVHQVTVTSKGRQPALGTARKIDLRDADLLRLQTRLNSQLNARAATYICLARQHNLVEGVVVQSSQTRPVMAVETMTVDPQISPALTFTSLIDLIDTHLEISLDDKTTAIINSPWSSSNLQSDFANQVEMLFAETTLNAAPQDGQLLWPDTDPNLLLAIPGIRENTRQWLIEADRSGGGNLDLSGSVGGGPQSLVRTMAEKFQQQQLDRSEWKILEQNLCESGDVFSAYVFAHSGNFRTPKLSRIIVDGSGTQPQQLYYRELSLPPAIVAAVRRITSSSSQPSRSQPASSQPAGS